MADSLEKTTRREILKYLGMFSMIGVGAIAAFGLSKGCKHYLPQEHVSTETYIDEFSIFDGAITLKKIETDGDFRGRGDIILSVKYEFEFNEPGHYLLEGWASGYRAIDRKTENWQFDIENVSEVRTEELSSYVYRLEASRVVDGKIQRDTVKLRHYGESGAAFVGIGDQLQ